MLDRDELGPEDIGLPEDPELDALAEQLARAYRDAGLDLPGNESSRAEEGRGPDPDVEDPLVEDLLELVVTDQVDREMTAAQASVDATLGEPGADSVPAVEAANASDSGADNEASRGDVNGPGDVASGTTDRPVDEPGAQGELGDENDEDAEETEEVEEGPHSFDDLDWGPVEIAQVVEALLFVGGKPLDPGEMARTLGDVSADDVERAVIGLARRYALQRRPYRVVRERKGYRLKVLPEYLVSRGRTRSTPRPVQLSPAALEVLAVIAYRQPVSVEEVDRLRGARSASVVRQLLRYRLIEPVPGTEDRRAKTRYRTTPRFLQVFRLSNLGDLPRLDVSSSTVLTRE